MSPAYEVVTEANSVRSRPLPLPRERGGGGPVASNTAVYEELPAFEGKSLSMKQLCKSNLTYLIYYIISSSKSLSMKVVGICLKFAS